MPWPENGIYILQGEMNLVIAAMRRTSRWSSHSYHEDENDPLIRKFSELKEILNHFPDLKDLDPNSFLSPFLDVIRSEDTTGPITGLALSSINKFLSYGMLNHTSSSASAAVENITDAVTHARFVGTDPSSDEVVLMKILQVLRTLVLTPVGTLLTNDSICEIMQSCFRICFEIRLSELLRKSAEHALMDMVQLLFARLPQFIEDNKLSSSFKRLKMRANGIDTSRNKQRKRSPRVKHKKISNTSSVKSEDNSLVISPQSFSPDSGVIVGQDPASLNSLNSNQPSMVTTPGDNNPDLLSVIVQKDGLEEFSVTTNDSYSSSLENSLTSTIPITVPNEGFVEMQNSFRADSVESLKEIGKGDYDISAQTEETNNYKHCDSLSEESKLPSLTNNVDSVLRANSCDLNDDQESISSITDSEFVNPQGVRFMQQQQAKEGAGPLLPYGLPCVRELFRFLISLINPFDKHNTDIMIHIGLSLLTVSLETGADYIGNFTSLLSLVKDDLSRNLFALINSERMSIFAATLRVCFLLFESLRTHLKFQLEMYLLKLMDIIASESQKISYEQREMVLDAMVQLWRIPCLVTELYLNYDCDLYCSNLFEDLTKLLSKNAFPVSGLYATHLLSLDALLTVVDSIEAHCHSRMVNERQSSHKSVIELETPKLSISDTSEAVEDTATVLFPSGFLLAQQLVNNEKNQQESEARPKIVTSVACRHPVSENIPNHEQLMAIKHKKKLLATGTEHFNNKPSKGIQFLQDNNLLSANLDPQEIVLFLKENPRLDKKMIGEYISNRKNLKILETFVKSFNFEETRVDEALRMYLETFRLPGEAPVISLLLEHFAEHWHKSNGEPFVNNDAAFTLAYAVIMLNVDQHNNNVKRQSNPMTLQEFKRNLSKVNGGLDFDQDMLEEIYNAIRNEEIVMPAEQTGLVKENYLWKVLLRRGALKDGIFIHAPNGLFDHDLFSLTWGPTVAALSFVFDKSIDETIIQRAVTGFRKCAMISAHYGMSDVFDNLVISLCKFTVLLSSTESPDSLPVIFGTNVKAQLAAKTVFTLAHKHGDILREGWKNILDCMLQLFKAKLLPKELIEAEDFVESSGHICLIREEAPSQRVDSGLFSSFYSYITLTSESQSQKGPTPEDLEAQQKAQTCIRDCHPEQLITESKFLQMDSLQELVKALIFASHGPDSHISLSGSYDEDAAVFFLELLIKIVLQNRDRVNTVWPNVRDHIYSLVMGASASEHVFLMERSVIGILRLAIRLLRREDMTAQVLQSLRMLLLLKPNTLYRVSRQISFALYELLKTTAANIHTSHDWSTLFTLLECAGAGAKPPRVLNGINHSTSDISLQKGAQSDSEINLSIPNHDASQSSSDRGYTSDSELSYWSPAKQAPQNHPEAVNSNTSIGGWILVGKEGDIESVQMNPVNQYNIVFEQELQIHDSSAFLKACESLAFLIRDVAHITPENFESCVHCIRTFVEASLNGGQHISEKKKQRDLKERKNNSKQRKEEKLRMKRSRVSPTGNSAYHADDEDEGDEFPGTYHQVSIQLLDLMHTLHTRAASIFSSWAEEGETQNEDPEYSAHLLATPGNLWTKCWCPLLQGIARLCCDTRRQVRTSAVTYLQRALLVHDLQTLSPLEWEACFNKVLFPLLAKLLENINCNDPVGLEETRMRGATLLCKVFLQHLTPLLSLPTFTALWLTILDFMDKYMHADKSDLLFEAIPESLKNMLLVMDTAGIFHSADGNSQLWTVTWDRIDAFLPNLRTEVFKSHQPESKPIAECEKESQDNVDSNIPIVTEAVTEAEVKPVATSNCQIPEESKVEEVASSPPKSPKFTSPDLFPPCSSVILQPPLHTTTIPTMSLMSSANPLYLTESHLTTPIPAPSVVPVPLSTPTLTAPSLCPVSVSRAHSIPLIVNPNIIGESMLSVKPSQQMINAEVNEEVPCNSNR